MARGRRELQFCRHGRAVSWTITTSPTSLTLQGFCKPHISSLAILDSIFLHYEIIWKPGSQRSHLKFIICHTIQLCVRSSSTRYLHNGERRFQYLCKPIVNPLLCKNPCIINRGTLSLLPKWGGWMLFAYKWKLPSPVLPEITIEKCSGHPCLQKFWLPLPNAFFLRETAEEGKK